MGGKGKSQAIYYENLEIASTESMEVEFLYVGAAPFSWGSFLSLFGSGENAEISVGVGQVGTRSVRDITLSSSFISADSFGFHQNSAPSGSIAITGALEEKQTLVADTSALADEDGLGTFSYQWLRDGTAIAGATVSAYTTTASDIDKALSVTVSYTDEYGTVETITSASSGTIANVNDAPTGSIAITGALEEKQTLVADTSALADEDGLGTFNYQWLRDGTAIAGATVSAYTTTASDIDKALSVTVSYTDGYGTVETITSASSGTIANVNDAPTGSIAITGALEEKQTLVADTSALADEDGLGTFSYQWLRDGTAIAGATVSAYTTTASDIDKALSVIISYTDEYGTVETITSASSGTIANVNDAPTGSIAITGALEEKQTLVADTSALADEDGLGTFNYQWLRDGTAIAGATVSAYTTTASDIDKALSVTVSYTDEYGTVETITSASSGTIANVNDAPTGSIAITGALEEKQTLVADTSSLADEDGLGTFNYQWLRDGTAIAGATTSTYTTTELDVDRALSVTVSYTDEYGTVETITSASSGTIANVIPTIISSTHRTSILVDKDVLGASPLILQGLTENIEKTDGVTTSHVFSYIGSDYDYDDISPFIMIVVRDNEFTDGFRRELADFAPEFKDISYQDAVAAVGLVGIADAIITVAGDDGNYIG